MIRPSDSIVHRVAPIIADSDRIQTTIFWNKFFERRSIIRETTAADIPGIHHVQKKPKAIVSFSTRMRLSIPIPIKGHSYFKKNKINSTKDVASMAHASNARRDGKALTRFSFIQKLFQKIICEMRIKMQGTKVKENL